MAGKKNDKAKDDIDAEKLFTSGSEEEMDPEMAATLAAEGLTSSSDEDDLEAQMAAAMAAEGASDSTGDEGDLEAQMAAAMAMEADESGLDEAERQMSIPMRNDPGRGERGFLDALSDDDDKSDISVQPLRFQQLRPSEEPVSKDDISRLMDVSLNLSVELGRKQMQIKEILELGPGKIVELEKLAGEPVDLLVNGKLLAKGEVVVVDENFGVRITELVDPKDRIKML